MHCVRRRRRRRRARPSSLAKGKKFLKKKNGEKFLTKQLHRRSQESPRKLEHGATGCEKMNCAAQFA